MNTLQRKSTIVGLLLSTIAFIYLGAQQSQAAWTSKESARVKALEARVKELETIVVQKSASYEMKTIRFLAVGANSGLMNDICPGTENFEGNSTSSIGRLAPRTDIFGNPVTGINGEPITYAVYRCKLSFWVPKL